MGGDTLISNQAIITYWPQQQERDNDGPHDTPEDYLGDWKNSHWASQKGMEGQPANTEFPFIERFMEVAPDAQEWTYQTLGIEWAPRWVTNRSSPFPYWDTFFPRIWSTTDIIGPINAFCASYDTYTELVNTEAYALIQNEDGRVVGVRAIGGDSSLIALKADKAVILTTGSFCNNEQMMSKYVGAQYARTGGGGSVNNTGDGIRMATTIGAGLTEIGLGVHCLPTTLGDTTPWCVIYHMAGYNDDPDGRGINDPAIYIDETGKRFTREAMGYSWLGKDALATDRHFCYFVVDADDVTDRMLNGQFLYQGDTLEELANRMNVPADVFVAEVERYNSFVDSGVDEDFGRTMDGATKIEKAPFYAVFVQPQPYANYGGLKVDVDSHVLTADGQVIEGLYAAGTTCGIFAEQEGLFYCGGVPQALGFGRQAGKKAAAE